MLSGIGGFVLGLIFLGLGLIIRHRSQKGKAIWGIGEEGLCLRPSARRGGALTSRCSSFLLTLKVRRLDWWWEDMEQPRGRLWNLVLLVEKESYHRGNRWGMFRAFLQFITVSLAPF